MKPCQKCIEVMYPENPTQPFFVSAGHYLPPLCKYCVSSDGGVPDLEEEVEVIQPQKWQRDQWDAVQQLRGQVKYLDRKVRNLEKPKKQTKVPEITDFTDIQGITGNPENYRKLQKVTEMSVGEAND